MEEKLLKKYEDAQKEIDDRLAAIREEVVDLERLTLVNSGRLEAVNELITSKELKKETVPPPPPPKEEEGSTVKTK